MNPMSGIGTYVEVTADTCSKPSSGNSLVNPTSWCGIETRENRLASMGVSNRYGTVT